VAAQAATAPDISVINLGTNDMGYDNANWQSDLDVVRGLVSSVPCVEFVTIYDGYHAPANNNVGTAINAYLAAIAAGDATRHVIDWNGAVDANPALLSSDHVHPTTAGRQWIADHIKAAIDADC